MTLTYAVVLLSLCGLGQVHGDAISSIANNFQGGVNNVRRGVYSLQASLRRAEEISLRKVSNEYVPRVSSRWHQACGGTDNAALKTLVQQVLEDASQCVRSRVPAGVPAVEAYAQQVLQNCDEYVARVRATANACYQLTGFQFLMCPATHMAPLGGEIGTLGGQVGQLGGQFAVLVDGSARQCTESAARARDVQATEACSRV